MLEFLWKYLIGPIVADAKNVEELVWQGTTTQPGYNPVNTVTYAFLAVTAFYLIYKFIQRKDIEFTLQTAVSTTPFILLGGTLRFLDDAQIIPYPYSIALITPLIYILIAGVYIPAVYKLDSKKLKKFGIILLVPALGYTLYSVNIINYMYLLGAIVLASVLTSVYYFIVTEDLKQNYFILLAFSQFFEGSASMLSTFYQYQPKQILTQTFNNIFGPPGILLIKTGLLIIGLKVIKDLENVKMKALTLITLYSVGLGTGFRVFLRAAAGT